MHTGHIMYMQQTSIHKIKKKKKNHKKIKVMVAVLTRYPKHSAGVGRRIILGLDQLGSGLVRLFQNRGRKV